MANEEIGDSQLFWPVLSRSAVLLAGAFLDRKKFPGPGLVGGPAGELVLDRVGGRAVAGVALAITHVTNRHHAPA